MFDYASIKKLSPNDVLILNSLSPLAEKAKEIEKQIKETYLFHIGEKRIAIWHDENNYEYLTYDGVWQARYLNQTYNVECTAETIFEYLKANYLIEKGYVKKYDGNHYTEEGKMASAFFYFNNFMNKTADKYSQTNTDK